MKFEWDPNKAASNLRKHGVAFDEASTVFMDALALSGTNPENSDGEARFVTFGLSALGRMLAVFHAYRSGAIRRFSARPMTRMERRIYEEG